MIVKPKLGDFESNLDVSASEWKNIVQAQEIFGEDFVFMAAVDTSYPIQDVFYDGAKALCNICAICENRKGISFISQRACSPDCLDLARSRCGKTGDWIRNCI